MSTISFDEMGPLKIIHVHEPSVNLRGILVVDNVARGPSIGGVRMAPDVSELECFRLARAMTLKNAAADLPHGGGKSVLFGDPGMPREQKEAIVRAFACALAEVEQYIFGPDMGTNEECMGWVHDEIGRAVGLPSAIGGIPLDEIGATGWGLLHAARAGCEATGIPLSGARVAIQGFGAVGRHAARFMAAEGAVVVAAADSRGTVSCKDGLDVNRLLALKREGGSVVDYPAGPQVSTGEPDDVINTACEILVPAARPDVITVDNVDRLQTRMVVSGANIAVEADAEPLLQSRGVLCIPDFIANAGGVICAALEYQGATQAQAFAAIEEKVGNNVRTVLANSRRDGTLPRDAAVELATARVRRAMDLRRWSLF
jgi:glutamate dehydrogenase (NAD(P)+)